MMDILTALPHCYSCPLAQLAGILLTFQLSVLEAVVWSSDDDEDGGGGDGVLLLLLLLLCVCVCVFLLYRFILSVQRRQYSRT